MSQRNHHHHKETTAPAKLLHRLENAQRRTTPPRSNQCLVENFDENQVDSQSQNPNPNAGQYGAPRESESYDIIRYDEPPAPPTPEPQYFNELYGQENNAVAVVSQTMSYSPERRAGGKIICQRARSLPPNSEVSNRLGANFPSDDIPFYNPQHGAVDNVGEYLQVENTGRRSPTRQSDEEAQSPRGRSSSKKVSYGQRSKSEKLFCNKRPNSPVQCRYRSDCMENEDSDLILSASNGRKGGRLQSPVGNRNYSSQPPPLQITSDRSFVFDGQSQEDFENRTANNNNNNYRVANRYSQESLPGFGGPPNNIYGQDVLALPIEIPDNVVDAEAFRRYLSVRRGAITPVRHQNISFEKRNQSCPSYESIGRKSRKPAMGTAANLAANGHLEHEARRRTSSLSHAIMTLALLSASICQLRFLITYSHAHSYPILNYFLVFTSIILEVAAGVGYVLIARCSYDDVHAESIHNYLIFALFIVAISNVILAAFAFDDHLCDELKWRNSRTAASSSQDQQFVQPMQHQRTDREMDLRYDALQ